MSAADNRFLQGRFIQSIPCRMMCLGCTAPVEAVIFFASPSNRGHLFSFRNIRTVSVLRQMQKIYRKNGCPKNESGYYPTPCSRDFSRIRGDPVSGKSLKERQ